MTYEFCTLFDINYLPRGLALYRSLTRVCPDFRLRVFCMDEEAERILQGLALPRLKVIPLAELERHDRALLEVKPTRTQLEYCWTATPAVSRYCLETEPDLREITYLDADLMFFSDPAPVFEEMGDDSVLIVPHRYAPQWRSYEETSGIYNVQFMTFRRDERGLEALHWWHDRCIEWCYYRLEDGKLGDQKYLDDWPERFDGVHVLEHTGGGTAPWNAEQYAIEERDGSVLVDGRPLVFYHYHSLKLFKGITALRSLGLFADTYQLTRRPVPLVWRQNYEMSRGERWLVWEPYLRELGNELLVVRGRFGRFDAGFVPVDPRPLIRARLAPAVVRFRRARAVAVAVRNRVRPPDLRETWKDPAVSRQMAALATDQLEHPDDVAPYRTFVTAIRSLVESGTLPTPARLLDFGCGVGHYSELLATSFPGRFLYTGCDYSESMIAIAAERWPAREFVVNDLFDNKLDLGAYDVVVAGALVDVIEDWEAALDLLLRSGTQYVILHRQQVSEETSRVEIVGGYSGQLTYRTYVRRAELLATAERNGYKLENELEVDGEVRTFVFRRVAA
jgi:Methyltransferase domain